MCLCLTAPWPLIDSCALIKCSNPEPTQRNAPVSWNQQKRSENNVGLWKPRATATKTHRYKKKKKKNSTKCVGRRTDSCSWCGSAREMYVSRRPCSSRAVANGSKCGSFVSCVMGQLLLLAGLPAWWLHDTVTPCLHVPFLFYLQKQCLI